MGRKRVTGPTAGAWAAPFIPVRVCSRCRRFVVIICGAKLLFQHPCDKGYVIMHAFICFLQKGDVVCVELGWCVHLLQLGAAAIVTTVCELQTAHTFGSIVTKPRQRGNTPWLV